VQQNPQTPVTNTSIMSPNTYIVNIIDCPTGDVSGLTVDFEGEEKVQKLAELLNADQDGSLFFRNQIQDVDYDETFEDAFEPEDSITVFRNYDSQEPDRAGKKIQMRNNCSDEIIAVVMNLMTEKPVFFDNEVLKTLRFLKLGNWHNRVKIYRKRESFEGEAVYFGRTYELPLDVNDHEYRVQDENLERITRDGTIHQVDHSPAEEDKKFERDFSKPSTGPKFKVPFKNVGTDDLVIVTGKKESYNDWIVKAGETTRFCVQKNQKGIYEFGLSAEVMRYKNEKEVQALMFNAQEYDNVKLINIAQTAEPRLSAEVVLTDNTAHSIDNIRTKHYRDSDRISKKDWLKWILPNTIKAGGKGLGAAVGCVTGNV